MSNEFYSEVLSWAICILLYVFALWILALLHPEWPVQARNAFCNQDVIYTPVEVGDK